MNNPVQNDELCPHPHRAVAKGASIVERHVTFDRTAKGSDHIR